MKRIILCIIIFIALIALTAGSYIYIVGTTTRLLNKIEFVSKSFSDGDFDAAFTAASEADRLWYEFRRRRYLIIDRDSFPEISEALARVKQLAKEKQPEILNEISVAKALLRQYYENQRVNWYNIL